MNENIEFEESAGNVYADLGLPNAEGLMAKSGLVIHIMDIKKIDIPKRF